MKPSPALCLLLPLLGCGSRTDLAVPDAAADVAPDAPPADAPPPCTQGAGAAAVDLLFAVDNSNSMADNQASLARNITLLTDQLINPPLVRDPATGQERPAYPPVRDLHVGVISTDLGTPGSLVPTCLNSDAGDDGLLNPIRNGLAMRGHQPWTTAAPLSQGAGCTQDPNRFPSFLSYDPATGREDFLRGFRCTSYLSNGGCSLEQQLEAAYRALVVHNPRAQAGNTDPNAGFVRDAALLGVVLVTDEEDGSVRDCRYAERGVPCTDAVSVFDSTSPDWSSNDLNLRFYLYTPGSRQDPTWPIDRYVDPRNPARGFPSLKPGHPEWVIFSAITGVPITLPRRGASIDWDALLGRNPDGSDGYTGMSPEGPVSMRQRNPDPRCPARVAPVCYREGSTFAGSCNRMDQYYAWPARRIAQVARRFDEAWGNGSVSSICRNDYSDALQGLVNRLQTRLCP